MKKIISIFAGLALLVLLAHSAQAQTKTSRKTDKTLDSQFVSEKFKALQWRNVGPFRGGRTVAASGVPGDPLSYYSGSVGGGVWKTEEIMGEVQESVSGFRSVKSQLDLKLELLKENDGSSELIQAGDDAFNKLYMQEKLPALMIPETE